jgi:hypothetical protein
MSTYERFLRGSDVARAADADAGLHADVIEAFGQQLLIVFLKRLGGKASIPLAEVDDTGRQCLAFRIDEHKVFHFEIQEKQ